MRIKEAEIGFFSTPGTKNLAFTRMSIAGFPPAAYRSIARAGLDRVTRSFFPSRCSVASSAASSSPILAL
jgi:hypothetical protein